MLSLNNAFLNVAILDPVADRERFGARYCTGGYIFQVTDHRCGDLLSGPTFPYSFNWFDGQGIPDSFRTHLTDTDDPASTTELGIGIGLINRTDNSVSEYCQWEVAEARGAIQFRTKQDFKSWSLQLNRTVRLENRTLISETTIKSTSAVALPLNWFPHPFFSLYENGECCKCNIAIRLPDNPAYELLPNGYVCQKNLPWDRRGFFQELDWDREQKVVILQKHPKIGLLAATFSYAPTYFPIWGNKYTFSFEPYYQRSVSKDEEVSWSVTYDF
jgi:hypothetical protein